MEYVQMIQTIELYFFASLFAGAAGMFFYGTDLIFSKRVKSYARKAKGSDLIFTSLSAMVWIMVLWAVVHMVVVVLA